MSSRHAPFCFLLISWRLHGTCVADARTNFPRALQNVAKFIWENINAPKFSVCTRASICPILVKGASLSPGFTERCVHASTMSYHLLSHRLLCGARVSQLHTANHNGCTLVCRVFSDHHPVRFDWRGHSFHSLLMGACVRSSGLLSLCFCSGGTAPDCSTGTLGMLLSGALPWMGLGTAGTTGWRMFEEMRLWTTALTILEMSCGAADATWHPPTGLFPP